MQSSKNIERFIVSKTETGLFVDDDDENHNETSSKNENDDIIQTAMGNIGIYQKWLCFILYLARFSVSFHQMSIVFLAPPTSYICPDTGNQTCPCPNPSFDKIVFTRTIVTEWNLICGDAWKKDFTQSATMVGLLVGSVLFGMASDRFGRRPPLIVAVFLNLISGTATAFAPDFWSFTFLRFLTGTSLAGLLVVGFVLSMEFVGKDNRDLLSALAQIPFNTGHILLPLIGFFVRDYKNFQLTISIPSVVLLSFFLLPESPRWLLAKGRIDPALKIIQLVAKVNKIPQEGLSKGLLYYSATKTKESSIQSGTILDLFRTTNIRKNIIAVGCIWLVSGFTFYGVSQFIGTLSGNIFINVVFGATITFCGTLALIPAMKKFGRKSIVISTSAVCSLCMLSISIIPNSLHGLVLPLASIGTMSSFMCLTIIFLYTSELFPTVVRNAALGLCSMMARVGSMLTPFIVVGLQVYGKWISPVSLGIAPLVGAIACTFLPETKGCGLMTSIAEAEEFSSQSYKRKIKEHNRLASKKLLQ